VSGLNHAAHDSSGKSKDGTDESQETKESQVLKLLNKYKIGQEIDLDDFGSLIPSEAKIAISKITRVSETKFKIERTWVGAAKINKDAGFIIQKSGRIIKGNSYIEGLKITPYGLPNSEITYKGGAAHTFNSFILSENSRKYLFNGSFYNKN